MATIAEISQDLQDAINANTGDQTALEAGTDTIVSDLFDNCNVADLDIIQGQIIVTCRRKKKE